MKTRLYISQTITITRPLTIADMHIRGRGGPWWRRALNCVLVWTHIYREVRTERELREAAHR